MKETAKLVVSGVAALILGLFLGVASAMLAIEEVIRSTAIDNGPWMTNLTIGSEKASPYVRAATALHGLLALRQPEAIYYTALTDSKGSPLDGRCTYKVQGKAPDARWWSITTYGNDDYLIRNDLNRYSYNMSNVTYDANGMFAIYISRDPQSGAWLPLGTESKFSLCLRLYNPGQSVRDNPGKIELPVIVKEGCK